MRERRVGEEKGRKKGKEGRKGRKERKFDRKEGITTGKAIMN